MYVLSKICLLYVRKTQTNLAVFISDSPHILALIGVLAQYLTDIHLFNYNSQQNIGVTYDSILGPLFFFLCAMGFERTQPLICSALTIVN